MGPPEIGTAMSTPVAPDCTGVAFANDCIAAISRKPLQTVPGAQVPEAEQIAGPKARRLTAVRVGKPCFCLPLRSLARLHGCLVPQFLSVQT